MTAAMASIRDTASSWMAAMSARGQIGADPDRASCVVVVPECTGAGEGIAVARGNGQVERTTWEKVVSQLVQATGPSPLAVAADARMGLRPLRDGDRRRRRC